MGDMTVGQVFSENSGGDMTQDGHDCRTYGIIHRYLYMEIDMIMINKSFR